MSANSLLDRREHAMGSAYRLFYDEPVHLVRGEGAWLHDADGKRYLDQRGVLRCKLVAHWYLARFEGVLDTIEGDGFRLRPIYLERRRPATWLKFAWLGVAVTGRHVAS